MQFTNCGNIYLFCGMKSQSGESPSTEGGFAALYMDRSSL
jgi:hypothetical protein